jgi:hypothetical protein
VENSFRSREAHGGQGRAKAYGDAEGLLSECLRMCQQKEADAWTTFRTQSLLGAVLLGQKKYADAEPLLVQGYQGMRAREARMPSASRFELTQALERLVQLYQSWGKNALADKWRRSR